MGNSTRGKRGEGSWKKTVLSKCPEKDHVLGPTSGVRNMALLVSYSNSIHVAEWRCREWRRRKVCCEVRERERKGRIETGNTENGGKMGEEVQIKKYTNEG